jgi:NitT/TauT family transport system substrate-binding protein
MSRLLALIAFLLSNSVVLANDLTPVRMGVVGASADVVFWAGVEKGYFAKEGIDLQIIKFDSAARMMAPLGGGDLQISAGGVSAGFFNAVARGIDIKIVADKTQTVPGLGTQSLVVRKDLIESGRYKTLADLKGLKVASPAPGSASMTIMTKMLARGGLTIKDINSVFLAVPQMTAAFTNKGLDAAVPLEPGVSQAVQTGLVERVIEDYDVYPEHQIAVIFYSSRFIRDHRKAAVGFMRAYLRSVRDLNEALQDGRLTGPGSQALIDVLTRYGPSQDPRFYQSFRLGFSHPDGKLHLPSLQEDLEIFKAEGLIEGEVSLDKAIDLSVIAEALKDVGLYHASK